MNFLYEHFYGLANLSVGSGLYFAGSVACIEEEACQSGGNWVSGRTGPMLRFPSITRC